jgi:hypothetical protein
MSLQLNAIVGKSKAFTRGRRDSHGRVSDRSLCLSSSALQDPPLFSLAGGSPPRCCRRRIWEVRERKGRHRRASRAALLPSPWGSGRPT